MKIEAFLVIDAAEHRFYRGCQSIGTLVEFQSGLLEVGGRAFVDESSLVLLRQAGEYDDRNVHGGRIRFQGFERLDR